jgi:hypothetical protein
MPDEKISVPELRRWTETPIPEAARRAVYLRGEHWSVPIRIDHLAALLDAVEEMEKVFVLLSEVMCRADDVLAQFMFEESDA